MWGKRMRGGQTLWSETTSRLWWTL